MAADKQRGRQTVRDMVLSLVVILLAAGVIYIFVPHDKSQNPVKPVGYRVELISARRAAPYPVLAPAGLPKTWRATSVRYSPEGEQGATWHLGFMTPDNQYAAVEQGDSAHPASYVHGVTQGAHKTAKTERVGGSVWTRYAGAKYDALVREEPGKHPAAAVTGAGVSQSSVRSKDLAHTTVVTGTASRAQLRELAAALRPGSGGGSGTGSENGSENGSGSGGAEHPSGQSAGRG